MYINQDRISPPLPHVNSSPQLKVTHTQLVLLLRAFAAYYSGNHTAVEAMVKELNSKLEQVERRDPPAWLEDMSGSHNHQ